jgi:hypothetical protein
MPELVSSGASAAERGMFKFVFPKYRSRAHPRTPSLNSKPALPLSRRSVHLARTWGFEI